MTAPIVMATKTRSYLPWRRGVHNSLIIRIDTVITTGKSSVSRTTPTQKTGNSHSRELHDSVVPEKTLFRLLTEQ